MSDPAVMLLVLALGPGLLVACQDVADGGHLVIPESCALIPPDLLGTWVVSHVVATLTCPAGTTLQTTATANLFIPVTAYRDESLPGYRIDAPGFAVRLEDSCRITWTYLDRDTRARYDCAGTFRPATPPATGANTEAGYCDRITLINQNGSTGATCAIPAPYLDTYLVVEAP